MGRDRSERVGHGEYAVERGIRGGAIVVTGYTQDVTDQHEVEARLRAAALEWSETFDAMSDSVALFGPDGRALRANAATAALTGRAVAEIVGNRCCEVFGFTDHPGCPVHRALGTGRAQTIIIEVGGRWLRASSTPRFDDSGHVIGGVHVVTDITPLHQAEHDARERSHFLEQLLKVVPVPIFYQDADLRFIGHNDAYAASLGRPGEHVIGKTVFDVRPRDLAERLDATNRDLLAHPDQVVEEELQMPGPDGTARWVRTHKAVFSDVAGQPAGIVVVNLDVTEIRRAQQDLAQSALRLRLTLEGAVAALGATTELRDPYTAGHQRRVAELACAIAVEVGLDEERTELLRTAALLHDVGKIVVPAEILSRPGHLSEIEMEIIRQHAAAGADIVGPIGFDPDVAEMVRQHHERLDGSGYPTGLRGDEILVEARVLAVADVVEAMVSHRPYRPGLPVDAAVAELEGGAGSLYDEGACRAAISLVLGQGFAFSQ
jgi:PAS domain S-box-containing protein/putative nucleotidyltransferase with HDIG domain